MMTIIDGGTLDWAMQEHKVLFILYLYMELNIRTKIRGIITATHA